MKRLILVHVICVYSTTLFSQNITNTLGVSGLFRIKDASNNYLTVTQSTGYLSLNKSLVIPNTTDSTLGVIFKGANRFIHNYSPDGADGYNTFIGINSGNFTMTGGYNTAIGDQSLFSNTEGYGNTTLGFQSLYSNTTGFQNTAVGLGSLQNNTTAYNNTAVGYLSLNSNTTGSENTALGLASLQYNTTAVQNTALGSGALQYNISGDQNVAVGFHSLNSSTIGYDNTAIGNASLGSNTRGNENVAVGNQSLGVNTIGGTNTAIGYQSLFSNVSGNDNVSVGHQSLYYNTTGDDNTSVGISSLRNNTAGSFNTVLGFYAGNIITTGNNLTCLGATANPTSGDAINQITLGNSGITSLRCAVTSITSLSDARDKMNIEDLDLGIDFLMKIKPRQFNWDKREWYIDNKSDGSKMKEEPTAGFIAQELDEAQITGKVEWLNLVLKDNPEKWEATPGNLLPIIVKAIQDLKKENDELQVANNELKTSNIELASRLDKFEKIQNILVTEIEKLSKNDDEIAKVTLGEK